MKKSWEAPEVKRKSSIAKEKAWKNFLNRFPKADKSRFVAEAHFDDKLNATAEVFFKESDSSYHSIFGSDRQYWSEEMKKALSLGGQHRVSLSIVATWFESFLIHPCRTFRRQSPKLEENIQH